MVKQSRNYRLTVQRNDLFNVIIELPFTVQFEIIKKTFASVSEASINIYNLSENNRNGIRKNEQDFFDIRTVDLQAGYNGQYTTVFSGNITKAFSKREGVNFITTILAQDVGFGFSNAKTSVTVSSQENLKAAISRVAGTVPNAKIGVIGNLPESSLRKRGNSYSGDANKILRELSGNAMFADNGVLNFLGDGECLLGELKEIDSANGLLGTPLLEQSKLNFDMLFEPRLRMGQLIDLTSVTERTFNGSYKVVGLSHSVEISAAECGDAITSVELYTNGALDIVI